MATSGSINYTRTRDQIIKRALRIVGVLAQGDLPSAEQTAESSEALNSMVKGWQGDGLRLWEVQWETETLTAASEVTGSDSSVYTCIRNLAVSAASHKPVTGADWTTYFIKRGSTGGAWANDTAYNAIGHIAVTDVLGITEAFWRDDSNDTPLHIMSRAEFMELTNKAEFGTPSKLYLDMSSLTSPAIFLWPQPDVTVASDLTETLHYNAIKRLEDFDAGSDTPDFDVKWIEALTFNLAYKLAYEYQLPRSEKIDIAAEASRLLEIATADSTEYIGMQLSVETQ